MKPATVSSPAHKLFAGDCRFVAGTETVERIPPPAFPEVAFVGRSNVGKSSLINALTNRKSLARASVTPGRTRQINFFQLADALMLVDLPGYGYAKITRAQSQAWNQLIMHYLNTRPNLKRVCLLIDARRGFMESDHEVMEMLDVSAVSYQLVLTKADKVTNNALAEVKASLEASLARHPAAYPQVIATSAEKRDGMELLRETLAAFAEPKKG